MATALETTISGTTDAAPAASSARSTRAFALAAAVTIGLSCALAGWAPLGFSIVTVFLFAGPHNWLEARYMLGRMPARWGRLRGFFITGIAGVLALTAGMAALHWLGGPLLDAEGWLLYQATWNSLLIAWIAALVLLRSRQNPRRDWNWAIPAALVLIGINWLWPLGWMLAIVYLHPLVALCFLDRELGRMRPEWQAAYRACLLLVPLGLGLLWWRLAGAPNLPGDDLLARQIAEHAGSWILEGVSTHLLVSTHTFLEMLHYGVWIVAMPLVGVAAAPWRVDNVPLARRSSMWRGIVLGAIALGAAITAALWGGFLADYALTRDVYFTVATLHVLAEVPFLLRLL
jgi:hypothetical protein